MKQLKNIPCSHYKVNDSVPFSTDWFFYINQNPLPWYYRFFPIVVEFVDTKQIPELLLLLSQNFSYVHVDKYLSDKRVVFTIVTNKSLLSIEEILSKINLGCKLIY